MASVSASYLHYGKLHDELHQRHSASFSSRSLRSPLTTTPLVGRRVSSRPRDETISSAIAVSALPDEFPSAITAGAAAATLVGFVAFRAFVYFRIQYIIAAMLGKYVPRGGCRVLDMDIHEGRNLYYYPSDVAEVVAVTNEKNCEVVKNQAIRAGVPVNIKVKALKSSSLPTNSMDAVVSVYCLCDLKEIEARTVLREAIRLLKPGKPFIFVENVIAEGGFLRMCQMQSQKILQLFGIQSTPSKDISKVLEEAEGLEKLEYETLFSFQDPHIVGIAMKQTQITNSIKKKRGIKKPVST